jgi:hypothetical protein
VYSLGLNNPLRICLTSRKLRFKNLWRNKQGNCLCKMAGTGICSIAKLRGQMPWIATTGTAPWQTALPWTADCQVLRSGIHAVKSSLWQSAHKCILLTVAIRETVILFVAIRSLNSWVRNVALDWNPPPPFYIENPLFEVSYIFAAWLLEYQIPTYLYIWL